MLTSILMLGIEFRSRTSEGTGTSPTTSASFNTASHELRYLQEFEVCLPASDSTHSFLEMPDSKKLAINHTLKDIAINVATGRL
jgi:hypothetical protein